MSIRHIRHRQMIKLKRTTKKHVTASRAFANAMNNLAEAFKSIGDTCDNIREKIQ